MVKCTLALALMCLTACNALLGNERGVLDPALDPSANMLPEAGPPDDVCSTVSCGPNAHCEPTPSANCVCNEGYEADASSCNQADPCLALACQNGGRCVRDANGARCDCDDTAFEGSACQTARGPCDSFLCVNGTCAADSGSTVCTCEKGFRGLHCDEVDRCADDPCGGRGTCNPLSDAPLCTCKPGWGGDTCNVSSCSGVSCKSGTTCQTSSGKVAFCYPTKCAASTGLCLAVNSDGTGRASTQLLTVPNTTFNFNMGSQTDNNWNSLSKYFAYLHQVGTSKIACVYPYVDYVGTPVRIELGTHQTTTAGFGQSNKFTDGGPCPMKQ